MKTCSHCLNPIPETAAQLAALEQSPDAEPCSCITARCGHRLCCEMDDHADCTDCGKCEVCCGCRCEDCGALVHANTECLECLMVAVNV